MVCQIAKVKGHTVIGSAGGAEKVAFLKEIGVDHAIDYKAEPDLTAALAGPRRTASTSISTTSAASTWRRRCNCGQAVRPLRPVRDDLDYNATEPAARPVATSPS